MSGIVGARAQITEDDRVNLAPLQQVLRDEVQRIVTVQVQVSERTTALRPSPSPISPARTEHRGRIPPGRTHDGDVDVPFSLEDLLMKVGKINDIPSHGRVDLFAGGRKDFPASKGSSRISRAAMQTPQPVWG